MAEETIIENLPMLLNLGDTSLMNIIGWATVYRNPETGLSRLDIQMDEHGSELLENLQEIAKIKAIGFAGIMRRPDGR